MKFSNIFKKIFLVVALFLYFVSSILVFPTKIHAQNGRPTQESSPESSSTWYNQGFTDWYAKVYGEDSPPSEIFGERYTAAQVQWILYSLFSFPINLLGSNMQAITACFYSVTIPIVTFQDLSCAQDVIEVLSNAIKIMNISGISQGPSSLMEAIVEGHPSKPASGLEYFISQTTKYSIVPIATAQGFGYNEVDGLQQYWQGFRNVAYALSVLVIVVFSFMIMFRVKISPQLVISIQSALPKVIGALILATFSYAIAGFVIDLSYVLGGVFASLMTTAGFSDSFTAAYNIIIPTTETAGTGAFYIFFWMFGYTIVFFIAALMTFIGTISGISVYGFFASIVVVLLSIWVLILMFWYTLKVPWVLLKNLISLFVSIVVAPVQIMMGALIPSIGFSVWLKKIIAESLVFPLTGLFMFLALGTIKASMEASIGQSVFAELGINLPGISSSQNLWSPPILGSSEDMAGILWLAVSFVFITMIPKAVDIMKMLIMGAKFDFGNAIGEAMTPAKMAGGLAVNPQIDRFELAAKKAMKTPWEVASKGGPSLQAKYISLSALQKWLSGR